MKTTIFGCVGFAITVYTVVIVLSICNNHSRSVNLQDNLQEAVESSLETALCRHGYDISNSDELIADVLEGVALYIDDNSTLDVEVRKADLTTGILSIRVVEHYTNHDGEITDIACDKTVILDHYDTYVANKYSVSYMIKADDGSAVPYKTYQLMDGVNMMVPVDPVVDGKTFVGWLLENEDITKEDIQNLPVNQSYVFVAKFN